jgi:cytochrome c oxidase cbb3-type subunit 3/ubiquinol-cytochrome c reductase cytochrome c subunit
MPPFAKTAGGMLTDQQIAVLAQGMEQAWGNPSDVANQGSPAYAASTTGEATRGQAAFTTFCARCHGSDGTGGKSPHGESLGSLVDPAYLALITDQGLRSFILAGQTGQDAHDWRSYYGPEPPLAMSDQQVTDVVAWLASHRIATPGQIYTQHP